jgi:uncharacterized protein YceK
MKKAILCALAACVLASGCALVESSADSSSPEAKTTKDDYVTGSRLRRNDQDPK